MSTLQVININNEALWHDVKTIENVIKSITERTLPCESRLELFINEMNKNGLGKFEVELMEHIGCAIVNCRGLKFPLLQVMEYQYDL